MKKIISIVALAYVNIAIPANADFEPSFGYWTKCTAAWVSPTVTSSTAWHPNCNSATTLSTTISNCATTMYHCGWVQTFANPIKFQTCFQCSSGYELKSVSISHGGCSYTYNTCEKIVIPTVSSCTQCPDFSNWVNTNDGYQQRYKQTCSSNKCNIVATFYRCGGNYYGKSSTGDISKSGCTRCPNFGYAIPGSNEAITNCFIKDGDDATGHFTFGTKSCYYTK